MSQMTDGAGLTTKTQTGSGTTAIATEFAYDEDCVEKRALQF